ncbi:MAG TPA: benzoyl-CoA reductase subunit A [Ignavibacteria bacterium]|nr:benzoyl-CoA reductase subunit A [Ignavibacteria bacterium]
MKKYYLGIDLGSTTSKAIIIDEEDNIIGRGITNTRANYLVATEVARFEAIYNARFSLLKMKLEDEINSNPEYEKYINDVESAFQYLKFKYKLDKLYVKFKDIIESSFSGDKKENILQIVEKIVKTIGPEIRDAYLFSNLGNKNQFFRDIVSERYNNEIKKLDPEFFDPLMLVYDKSIISVENELTEFNFKELISESIEIMNEKYAKLDETLAENNSSPHFYAEINLLKGNYKKIYNSLKEHLEYVANMDIHISNMVGTGYGRALLPFPEKSIKSEILCHAFGAHAIFPNTRTVLDIGGQDTKAIQVDKHGLVTSFHMNDRCAAGCGRYLGYIADEFNISLNELGPLALDAKKEVNICSTCTVFAGAEIRELLNVGQKRSDILAGLHRSIVMRAISLLARSGGVRNEFSFTGGVARNQAVLKYVSELIHENYGDDIKINIGADSIFMGALGGAMFARRSMKNLATH